MPPAAERIQRFAAEPFTEPITDPAHTSLPTRLATFREGSVRLAPELAVSCAEFESIRSAPILRNDLLQLLGAELITPEKIRRLHRLNPLRSPELIQSDCLIAINTLIDEFIPAQSESLFLYISASLTNRVVDIWRQEDGRQGPSERRRNRLLRAGPSEGGSGRHSVNELAVTFDTSPTVVRQFLHRAALRGALPQADLGEADGKDLDVAAGTDALAELMIQESARVEVAGLVKALPPKLGGVLALRARGLSFAEIGAMNGRSTAWASQTMKQAQAWILRERHTQTFDQSGFDDFLRAFFSRTAPDEVVGRSSFITAPSFFSRYLDSATGAGGMRQQSWDRPLPASDIVGQAAGHLVSWLDREFGGVDFIPGKRIPQLARLLGVPPSRAAVIGAVCERGIADGAVPLDRDWHERIFSLERRSVFFDPAMVGAEQAERNIDRHVEVILTSPARLEKRRVLPYLARLLEVPSNHAAVAAAILAREVRLPEHDRARLEMTVRHAQA